jgi:hypothetical protein
MIETGGKAIIKISLIVLIVTGIIGYSIFQSRNLINGPQITLSSPQIGSTLTNSLVHIQGKADNISFITLNDRQIFVDKDGNFDEELLLEPGYNAWQIQAKDKFGRIVTKKIELVLKAS